MKQTNFQAIFWVLTALLAACGSSHQTPVELAESRQPVEIRAFLDKAVATTGDQINYTVEIDRQKDVKVEMPEPGAEIAGLRIIDSRVQPPEEEGNRIIERRIYQLRADLVGSYVLPEVRAKYFPHKSEDQQQPEPVTIRTSRIFLEVKSVLPKDERAKDIRGLKPLERPELGFTWWTWLILSVVAIGISASLFWWIRKRGRKTVAIPERSPHEIAFESLDALRKTDFDDPNAVRKFYFLISEIVRLYIERRFDLNATDLTTKEILDRASNLPESDEKERRLLSDFLVHTDLVKFADLRPDETQIQNCYEQAVRFVEITIPDPRKPADQSNRRAA